VRENIATASALNQRNFLMPESTVPPPVMPTMTKKHVEYSEFLAYGGSAFQRGRDDWQLQWDIVAFVRSIVNGDSVVVPRKASERELGWLVEDVWSDGAIVWWCGDRRFSSNHLEAIRFARREDAEAVIRHIATNGNLKAVEHMWLTPDTPQKGE
jgi:hypothetical protein